MAAYIIFTREKTLDRAELEIYWSQIRATMEGHPIRVLAAYGLQQTLEGPETEGTVIAEFPTMEAAHAWYDSPAYQAAALHRFKGAVYRGLLIEGVKAPTAERRQRDATLHSKRLTSPKRAARPS
jgi:uncharacterized protein (DUF1330 family)